MTLLDKVKSYVRLSGSEDDMLLASLISAAKQYLLNAGVQEPPETGGGSEGPGDLYDLAVSLYVSLIFDGADEKLDRAMTAIILQIKNYGNYGGGGETT